MSTIIGASKKAIACQSYPILAIFADFQGLFWSTYRYRKILSRIVLEPPSKNSPGRGGSVWPNGNINIQISWKTALAGKFARRCRYELRSNWDRAQTFGKNHVNFLIKFKNWCLKFLINIFGMRRLWAFQKYNF